MCIRDRTMELAGTLGELDGARRFAGNQGFAGAHDQGDFAREHIGFVGTFGRRLCCGACGIFTAR